MAKSSASWDRGTLMATGGRGVENRQQIREDEAVALDDLSWRDCERRRKHRPRESERMEFTLLAARFHGSGQLGKQAGVKRASGKAPVELARIDASEVSAQATGNHFAGKPMRLAAPEGKNRRHANGAQFLLAVTADVFKKKITEGDVKNGLGAVLRQVVVSIAHARTRCSRG